MVSLKGHFGQVAGRREASFMNQSQNLGFWSADFDTYEQYLEHLVGSAEDFERDELLDRERDKLLEQLDENSNSQEDLS
jgi:hypothetical protein